MKSVLLKVRSALVTAMPYAIPLIKLACWFVGCGGVASGAWLIDHRAGLIVGGILLMWTVYEPAERNRTNEGLADGQHTG